MEASRAEKEDRGSKCCRNEFYGKFERNGSYENIEGIDVDKEEKKAHSHPPHF